LPKYCNKPLIIKLLQNFYFIGYLLSLLYHLFYRIIMPTLNFCIILTTVTFYGNHVDIEMIFFSWYINIFYLFLVFTWKKRYRCKCNYKAFKMSKISISNVFTLFCCSKLVRIQFNRIKSWKKRDSALRMTLDTDSKLLNRSF